MMKIYHRYNSNAHRRKILPYGVSKKRYSDTICAKELVVERVYHEFQQAMMLNFFLNDQLTMIKYTSRLYAQIHIELSFINIYDILIASNIVIVIERKNYTHD